MFISYFFHCPGYPIIGWHTFWFVCGILSGFYYVGTSVEEDAEVHMFSFITTIIGNLPSVIDRIFIRGNLGSKMGLIRKRAKISFCELEFKNQ